MARVLMVIAPTVFRDEEYAQPKAVLEARGAQTGPVFRIETLTVADARCVYDIIYAAPVDLFDDHHGDFDRLVGSFTME